MNEILDVTKVVFTLSFLVYASWSDWKKREVSNKVWTVFAPLALLLTSVQFLLLGGDVLLYVLSFTVTSGLAIILFYAGAFGGADAKAFICLSLALPHYPTYFSSALSTSASTILVSPLFPITVFSNSVLLASLTVVYTLLRNLSWKLKTRSKLFKGFENDSFGRKLLALLTGYKVNVTKLERYDYLYPLEDLSATEESLNGADRQLLVMPKDEDRQQIVARLSEAVRTGKIQNGVWATPGLPMLIFVTVGLVLALVIGDLVWIFLGFVLR